MELASLGVIPREHVDEDAAFGRVERDHTVHGQRPTRWVVLERFPGPLVFVPEGRPGAGRVDQGSRIRDVVLDHGLV